MIQRLHNLKSELVAQGREVQRLMEQAVEAMFAKDQPKAEQVIAGDAAIDSEDVRIERRAVQLLADAGAGRLEGLDEYAARLTLTIVKVNNELERNADLAVVVAEQVKAFARLPSAPPQRFRVMANSVIGIMHTTLSALDKLDTTAAQIVLASDDATEAFKDAILREIEHGLVLGKHTVDEAFALHTVANALARMADHCTNVAEQVIYVATGNVVRHEGERWGKPEAPKV
ncbi:MAG: hypothetical protein IBJ11_12065 [Phycisphaerales bacterium]|nr:hypothetical protein [Phycisphaerales bacterium]